MSLTSKIISIGVIISLAALVSAATLKWSYLPLPEDIGRPVGFNIWESPDLAVPLNNWNWIGAVTNWDGTATNLSFTITIGLNCPVQYFACSSFFITSDPAAPPSKALAKEGQLRSLGAGGSPH